jgi:hypothetical protein
VKILLSTSALLFLSNRLAIGRKEGYIPTLNERYGLVGHAYPLEKLVREI